MSLLRDGLHDVMEVVLRLDFALDKSWYDAKHYFHGLHENSNNMREELGSRNVSNKTVDMHSLQRLVCISIKRQYHHMVYILFKS